MNKSTIYIFIIIVLVVLTAITFFPRHTPEVPAAALPVNGVVNGTDTAIPQTTPPAADAAAQPSSPSDTAGTEVDGVPSGVEVINQPAQVPDTPKP